MKYFLIKCTRPESGKDCYYLNRESAVFTQEEIDTAESIVSIGPFVESELATMLERINQMNQRNTVECQQYPDHEKVFYTWVETRSKLP